MLYAPPDRWGFTSAEDRGQIKKFMSNLRRGGYLSPRHPSYEELAGQADGRLLKSITSNPYHVLNTCSGRGKVFLKLGRYLPA